MQNKSYQLIILDRDGVINEDSDQYIKSAEEWVPVPGSIEAIAALSQAGYPVAVATNQSGLARGYYDEATLERMHDKMGGLLAEQGGRVDYMVWCPHGADDGCSCRKPLPGMLLTILKHYGFQAADCCFVGDSYTDYQAAAAIDMPFFLVRTGKGERTLSRYPHTLAAEVVFDSLNSFMQNLLPRTAP